MCHKAVNLMFGLLLLSVMAGIAVAEVQAKFDYGCEPRANWCAELTCTFDGSASTSSDSSVLGYRWYFRRYLAEDRESEYGTRTGVRVTYNDTNTRCRSYTYYATLEITDALGNKNSHTEQVDPSRRTDFPPENQSPIADFSASCEFLECAFDATASYDPDGGIASYAWNFGDGNTGSGQSLLHAYGAPGTYTVYLTVADHEGATAIKGKTVSVVEEPAPGFNLAATGRKARGLQKADLAWTGADSSNVDVYRNGARIVTTPNDGFHTDNIDLRGPGTYVYQVCEEKASICSNESTVIFE